MLALQRQHGARIRDGAERRIIDAAQPVPVIERRRARDDIPVGRGIGADDHLRRLAGSRSVRRLG